RKPLRCSGDRDGALHGRRVVLAEERVAAGGRGREGRLGVLAALDVLAGVAGGEGEVVLDAVLVGHLEGVAGTGLEIEGGGVPGRALRGQPELVLAAPAGRGGRGGAGGLRGGGGRARAPAVVFVSGTPHGPRLWQHP